MYSIPSYDPEPRIISYYNTSVYCRPFLVERELRIKNPKEHQHLKGAIYVTNGTFSADDSLESYPFELVNRPHSSGRFVKMVR